MMSTAMSKDRFAQDAHNQGKKIADEAKSAASKVTDRAREAGSFIADKAEACTEAVGAGMENVGHAVRDYTPKALGTAGEAIADRLEGGGRYLEEKGMSGVGDDLTKLIRNNPVPALLAGIGLGFVLARLLRS